MLESDIDPKLGWGRMNLGEDSWTREIIRYGMAIQRVKSKSHPSRLPTPFHPTTQREVQSLSISAAPRDQGGQCLDEETKVEPEGSLLDVFQIKTHLLFKR